MGYRGKLAERDEARRLRAQSWTLADIASWLGVSKSSVSVWVRDVEFVPSPRRTGARTRPNVLHTRKLEEIARLNEEGVARIGKMSEREFLVAGIALYAGEGAKTDGEVKFTNSDAAMIGFFCAWLRHFFEIDESRLRLQLYLHVGLDLAAATAFWAELTGIPAPQHHKPYRAAPDLSIRKAKHPMGCLSVRYACTRTHRSVMGLVHALLASQLRNPG